MPEITIRVLGLADRAAWADLRHALWPHHSAAELGDELEEELRQGKLAFGAFAGGELIAFAEASQRLYGDGCDTSPVAWLEGIYVAPAHRRGGLGRRLVGVVEDWARAEGLTELGSDADLGNLLSRLSHARWGFEETERVVMFRKVLS